MMLVMKMMCPPALTRLALALLAVTAIFDSGRTVQAAEIRTGGHEPVNKPFLVKSALANMKDQPAVQQEGHVWSRRNLPSLPEDSDQNQQMQLNHMQQSGSQHQVKQHFNPLLQANQEAVNQQAVNQQAVNQEAVNQQAVNQQAVNQQAVNQQAEWNQQAQQQNVQGFNAAGAEAYRGRAEAAPPVPETAHRKAVNHMEELNKQRVEEQRVAQEMAFRQQELHRQQQQERVRQQQENIRRQLEQHQQFQLQQHQEELQKQKRQQAMVNNNNNNNDNNNVQFANNVKLNVDAHQQNPPEEAPRRSDIKVPTPRYVLKQNEAERESVQEQVDRQVNEVRKEVILPPSDHQERSDNVQSGKDTFPDVQQQQNSYNNENRNGDAAEGFQRDSYREEPRAWESNLNNVPVQRDPPEEHVREIGGMRINWDWDDFSITFDSYGAAEMKVRRAHHATTGEPWPLPQYYTKKDKNILVVDPDFQFDVSSNISCDVIDQALERYKNRILQYSMEDMYDNLQNAAGTYLENPEVKYRSAVYQRAPVISKFSLKIRKPCTVFPSMDSDESYDLVVKKTAAYLWANEVWGLLRGLETLSQIIWRGPDDRLYVKESVISDYPRFPHRGILIDSSRHFIFKEVLYDMMDAMEMNKMNVIHWHIVDDQSFPYESQVYPELSGKGAYHPSYVYSLEDIADLLEYARMRGIRILPEFDSPGHTYSWGLSHPELLTQCYSGSSPIKGYLGPVDPIHNSSYHFLRTLFEEVLHVFKDEFIHLGGDEVPLGCWQSNPDVSKFGEKLSQESDHGASDQVNYFGGPSPSIRLVYEYYVNRLMKDIKDLGKKRNGVRFIMWQEVINNDLKLPNDTLIQVWMGDMTDVSKAISKGYDVLYSSCWYLDHVEYGVKWPKYYNCDPADNSYGYNIDEKKVKGGEACLWSEYIDNENLIQTTWPRASAVAERLWSSKDTRNLDTAGERLSEHRCRMLRRGLTVGQVSGPDYCLKRGPQRGSRGESGCQGDGCKSRSHGTVEEKSDFQVRLRSQGRALSDCSWVGGNVTIVLLVAVIAAVILISLSRTNSKLNPLRACRQRTILLIFLGVTFVYFMCFTTMWMHVFEFSGSFRKSRPLSSSS